MTVQEILDELNRLFPDAKCELVHRNNYEMAVAVVLSAQTTDASVNRVTPHLFEDYPTPEDLANASLDDIEKHIATLGLYRNKARQIKGLAKGMVENFNGEVPNTMKNLLTLDGIGRKCGNVILSECYGVPALAVDTHVSRISKRLKLCKKDDSVDVIEKKLKRKIPRERWIQTHHQMIFFGRYLCHARNPECVRCPFVEFCTYYKEQTKTKRK